MSASSAQIEANRANAQHSTGPSTPEGKAVSSRNAVKHGFLAKVLPAEQQDYRELLQELETDLQPAGLLQRLLVEDIALSYIRLRRLHQAEMLRAELRDIVSEGWDQKGKRTDTFHMEGISPYDMLRDKNAHLVLRYESGVQRHIQRCLTRLREMKADQTWKAVARAAAKARSEPDHDSEAKILSEVVAEARDARLHQEQQFDRDTPPLLIANLPRIGFVSQKHDSRPAPEIGFVSQKHNNPSPAPGRRRNRPRNRPRPGPASQHVAANSPGP